MIQPAPGWALIQPIEKTKSGVLEIPESSQSETHQGKIIDIVPYYYTHGGKIDLSDIFAVGDTVAYRKYQDQSIEYEGKKYKLIPCEHLIAVIK